MFFRLVTSMGQRKNSESPWDSIPHEDSDFFPLSHARGKTKSIFLYWLLLKKSVPYSSPCFPTENTIFLVFVKVLLWLFTIQGTIFIVVQNQWEKFMLKINSYNISLALCFSEECFIPLYNSLAQIKQGNGYTALDALYNVPTNYFVKCTQSVNDFLIL